MAARKYWWIEREIGGQWLPMLDAQGGAEYVRGYRNALDGMYPHPEYRVYFSEGGFNMDRKVLHEIVKAVDRPTTA